MKYFQQLGRDIEREWKARDFAHSCFASIAATALERHPPSSAVSSRELLDDLFKDRELPRQNESTFGDLPIVVFQAADFYIEVLFWLDSTTAVHEHGFQGAFHVMEGSSLHTRFHFEEQQRLGDRVLLGDLRSQRLELLRTGAVVPIQPGCDFIHSLFHLARPSVSVVVRTRFDVNRVTQLTYLRDVGIAFDPFYRNSTIELRCRALQFRLQSGEPQALNHCADLIRRADSFEALRYLMVLAEQLEPTALAEFCQGLGDAHPELVRRSDRMAKAIARERFMRRRRSQISDPDHRFLLALLLNANDRQDCLAVTEAAYPGQGAASLLLRWVQTLADMPSFSHQSISMLGARIDEPALAVLREMLEHESEEAVLQALGREYSEQDIERERPNILRLCQALRESVILAPLVRSRAEASWPRA